MLALKQFLRRHQAPANVFYSAYPASSVLNLKRGLEFLRRYQRILHGLSQGEAPQTAMRRESSETA
jgi:hypothetical protein